MKRRSMAKAKRKSNYGRGTTQTRPQSFCGGGCYAKLSKSICRCAALRAPQPREPEYVIPGEMERQALEV